MRLGRLLLGLPEEEEKEESYVPRYRITVTWSESQTTEIEAEDEAAARAFAEDMNLDCGEYVCHSFEIQSIEELPMEAEQP